MGFSCYRCTKEKHGFKFADCINPSESLVASAILRRKVKVTAEFLLTQQFFFFEQWGILHAIWNISQYAMPFKSVYLIYVLQGQREPQVLLRTFM